LKPENLGIELTNKSKLKQEDLVAELAEGFDPQRVSEDAAAAVFDALLKQPRFPSSPWYLPMAAFYDLFHLTHEILGHSAS
jgi:hypothetical protein